MLERYPETADFASVRDFPMDRPVDSGDNPRPMNAAKSFLPNSLEAQAARLKEIRVAWREGKYDNWGGSKEFALEVGIDPTRWSGYERAKGKRDKIPDDAIERVAAATGASFDYIRTGRASGITNELQHALTLYRSKRRKRKPD